MPWKQEIIDLHRFFEAYFLGTEDSLDRAAAVLHRDFTIVGPDGDEADRDRTLDRLRSGHGHATALTITTTDHRLLHEAGSLVVARYVEHHRLADSANERLTTVVFAAETAAPHGLAWLRVHETWLDRPGP